MLKSKKISLFLIIVILLEIVSIVFLKESDSYYSIYFIIGIGGLASTITLKNAKELYEKAWRVILSLFYSLVVTLSNINTNFINFDSSLVTVANHYDSYSRFEAIGNTVALFIIFLGWFFISINVINALDTIVFAPKFNEKKENTISKLTPNKAFLITFVVILSLNIIHFILFSSPGTVSEDNCNQIRQIISNSYNNHHPFFHTIILQIFIRAGIGLFGKISYGIALFTITQIVIVSAIMSWCAKSVYEIATYRKVLLAILIWYLIPYNIVLESCLTKDVLFSAMLTILTTSLIRIFYVSSYKSKKDYIFLFLGIVGTGLLRSNGTIIVIVSAILILLFSISKSEWRKLAFTFILGMVLCIILKYPILYVFNVPQTEFAEGLSIPLQQVSRCIVDGCELKDEEYEFINQALPIEEIKKRYNKGISDPIKGVDDIKAVDNEYLSNNKMKCLKLWIGLGVRYPKEYLLAYVDQTKGFWNGGYNYSTVGEYIADDAKEIGIKKLSILKAKSIAYVLTNMFRFIPLLDIMISIGVHIWVLIFAFTRNVFRGKSKLVFTLLPYLLLVLSLWITTPVYTQFRYAYAIFMGFPIILVSIFGIENKSLNRS